MEEHIGQIMDVERVQEIYDKSTKKMKKHLLLCALASAVGITSMCLLGTNTIVDKDTTSIVGFFGVLASGAVALASSAFLGQANYDRKKAKDQLEYLKKC